MIELKQKTAYSCSYSRHLVVKYWWILFLLVQSIILDYIHDNIGSSIFWSFCSSYLCADFDLLRCYWIIYFGHSCSPSDFERFHWLVTWIKWKQCGGIPASYDCVLILVHLILEAQAKKKKKCYAKVIALAGWSLILFIGAGRTLNC